MITSAGFAASVVKSYRTGIHVLDTSPGTSKRASTCPSGTRTARRMAWGFLSKSPMKSELPLRTPFLAVIDPRPNASGSMENTQTNSHPKEAPKEDQVETPVKA